MTSWLVVASISATRATSKAAVASISPTARVGHLAEPVPGLHGGDLDVQPGLQLGLFGPDGAHLGECVALDHGCPSVAAVTDGQILSQRGRAPSRPAHRGARCADAVCMVRRSPRPVGGHCRVSSVSSVGSAVAVGDPRPELVAVDERQRQLPRHAVRDAAGRQAVVFGLRGRHALPENAHADSV